MSLNTGEDTTPTSSDTVPNISKEKEAKEIQFSSLLGVIGSTDDTDEEQREGPVGIIFDMDGTLVEPCIDFSSMRRRIYNLATKDFGREVNTGCVLELFERLSESSKVLAKEVFDDIERQAIQDMVLMDGMVELMKLLDERGVHRAVLTRNVETSIDAMHDKVWKEAGLHPFYPVVARDTSVNVVDGNMQAKRLLKSKPNPDPIFHICSMWDCDPVDVIMVGDSVLDDIVCANRAGCGASVLLKFKGKDWDNDSGNSSSNFANSGEMEPTIAVDSLIALKEIFITSK